MNFGRDRRRGDRTIAFHRMRFGRKRYGGSKIGWNRLCSGGYRCCGGSVAALHRLFFELPLRALFKLEEQRRYNGCPLPPARPSENIQQEFDNLPGDGFVPLGLSAQRYNQRRLVIEFGLQVVYFGGAFIGGAQGGGGVFPA